jgi:hypothetical protein
MKIEKCKVKSSFPPEQHAMNAEDKPDDRRPITALFPGAGEIPSPRFYSECTSGSVTTYTYFFEEEPNRFDFEHEEAKGLFVLTRPDGTAERFRDKSARYLVVEPDADTGELRPAVKHGRPVYQYLCREEKELQLGARSSAPP